MQNKMPFDDFCWHMLTVLDQQLPNVDANLIHYKNNEKELTIFLGTDQCEVNFVLSQKTLEYFYDTHYNLLNFSDKDYTIFYNNTFLPYFNAGITGALCDLTKFIS